MNENKTLNTGLHIPNVNLTEQRQLQLYQQSHSQSTHNTYINNDLLSNNAGIRQSSNSISSLSHATQQSVVPLNAINDTESIAKVINICNEIDTEDNCGATESLVRKCIRNQIWCTNKFITDNTIKHMKIENRTNPKSILNILLHFTQKDNLNNIDRLKFWKKYGPVVQLEVNVLKTICTRAIKDEMMIGKFLINVFK